MAPTALGSACAPTIRYAKAMSKWKFALRSSSIPKGRACMVEAKLHPRSAFDNLALRERPSGPTMEAERRVVRREGPALSSVVGRAGQGGALRARIKERFGLDRPDGPRRAE